MARTGDLRRGARGAATGCVATPGAPEITGVTGNLNDFQAMGIDVINPLENAEPVLRSQGCLECGGVPVDQVAWRGSASGVRLRFSTISPWSLRIQLLPVRSNRKGNKACIRQAMPPMSMVAANPAALTRCCG